MQKKIKHSKFRNTGILFELLVRQVTSDILQGKNDSKANYLLQKYFKESTELGKELGLYQLVLKENVKSEISANNFIDVVLRSRKKLNNTQLAEQKYNLIKEIKDCYPIDDFLKGKISNYRLLASIYKVFEEGTTNKSFDAKDIFESKSYIVESLYRKPAKKIPLDEFKDNSELIEIYNSQDEDSKFLIYKLLVDSFNKKYSSVFNDRQRGLLKEYIYNISNTNSLREYINKEVDSTKKELKEKSNTVSDNILRIKLLEVHNQIDKIKEGSVVKDNQVISLLNVFELIKELEISK